MSHDPSGNLTGLGAPVDFEHRCVERRFGPRCAFVADTALTPPLLAHAEQLPSYNAYSIDGEVTAPLVFVNHGIPEEFQILGYPILSIRSIPKDRAYLDRYFKEEIAAGHPSQGVAGFLESAVEDVASADHVLSELSAKPHNS